MEHNNGEHLFTDVGQLILLVIFLAVWVVDSFFLHLTTLLTAWVPLYLRLGVAGVVLALGIYLMSVSHFIVRPENRQSRGVDSGIFRHVRHPLYLASIVTFLSLVVSTLSLAALAVWVVIFCFYDYVSAYEEQYLINKFGEAYRVYRSKTGKWLPKIGAG